MKKTISESEFVREFDEYDRSENFSIEGRRALYNWLCDLEEDTETEQELDIIALCCDFSEYEDIEEFATDYTGHANEPFSKMEEVLGIERSDYDTDEEFKEAIKEELQNQTLFIDINEEAFIIQCF